MNSEQQVYELSCQVELLVAQGVDRPTEQVLATLQEVEIDDELVVSLLYAEFAAGEEGDSRRSEADLIGRFPHLQDRISRLIAVHRSLEGSDDEPVLSGHRESTINQDQLQTWSRHAAEVETEAPVQIEQFEIVEKLGHGGMGIVYKAQQKSPNRTVALKVLRSPLVTDEDRKRMINEANAAARLQHPNIVQIYQVGNHESAPFLCFEYVDGENLLNRLSKSTMSSRTACEMLRKIAAAIGYAHNSGVIHRDIKPANILIDGTGEPKVTDFGLAKFVDDASGLSKDKLTQTGALLGSVCYMAPEQIVAPPDGIDRRVDIYGLGAILYEMLVGRPPFMGESPYDTIQLIKESQPVALRGFDLRIPRDVETICLKCLEKDPAKRFQTAGDLIEQLDRFLSDRPLSIRPVSWTTKAVRWCRRRPTVAALSGLSALLILALTVGGYWMAWSQSNLVKSIAAQRDLARSAEKRAVRSAEDAQRTKEFVIDALASANPSRDGRNVTVAERLDEAMQLIDQKFPEDNAIKASLLVTIGQTYDALGLYKKARLPIERAFEIQRTELGDDEVVTLDTENLLGRLYADLEELELARERLEHASEELTEQFGLSTELSVRASNNLAMVLADLGHGEEALQRITATLEQCKREFGQYSLITLATVMDYGNLLDRGGHDDDVLALMLPLMKTTEKRHPDSVTLIGMKSSVADAYASKGELESAILQYDELLEQSERVLGENHSRTLNVLASKAVALAKMSRLTEAIDLQLEVADRIEIVFGPLHSESIRSKVNVAKMLEARSHFGEAFDIIEPLYMTIVKPDGRATPETRIVSSLYGSLLIEQQQLDRAFEILESAIHEYESAEIEDPEFLAMTQGSMAKAHAMAGNKKDAITWGELALATVRDSRTDRHPSTWAAMNNLAGYYNDDDQFDRGQQMYNELLIALRKRFDPVHQQVIYTEFNIAIGYKDRKQHELALKQLERLFPKLDHPEWLGSWFYFLAQFQLGRSYLDCKQFSDAGANLEESFVGFEAGYKGHAPAELQRLANQFGVIARQFDEAEMFDAAETWRQRQCQFTNLAYEVK